MKEFSFSPEESQYDIENKLKIKRIYDYIPSVMQNTKKRIVAKDIEGIVGKRFANYVNEFDYLISSGIALEVKAISNPVFPLIQSADKNLLKLYMNDVGLLSGILYNNNAKPILEDVRSVNLGALYETAVAGQLKALGHKLFYYDNRNNGEVDFMIDDYDNLAVLPVEVKSGRDYTTHSALNHFITNDNYPVKAGYVLSNERVFGINLYTTVLGEKVEGLFNEVDGILGNILDMCRKGWIDFEINGKKNTE